MGDRDLQDFHRTKMRRFCSRNDDFFSFSDFERHRFQFLASGRSDSLGAGAQERTKLVARALATDTRPPDRAARPGTMKSARDLIWDFTCFEIIMIFFPLFRFFLHVLKLL